MVTDRILIIVNDRSPVNAGFMYEAALKEAIPCLTRWLPRPRRQIRKKPGTESRVSLRLCKFGIRSPDGNLPFPVLECIYPCGFPVVPQLRPEPAEPRVFESDPTPFPAHPAESRQIAWHAAAALKHRFTSYKLLPSRYASCGYWLRFVMPGVPHPSPSTMPQSLKLM